MLKYKDKKFNDYIELEYYMINVEEAVNEKLFPHSKYFYIRNLLQQKFKQSFSIKYIKDLLEEEFKQ